MTADGVTCPSCSFANDRSASFCVKCGRRLDPAQAGHEPEPHESPTVPKSETEVLLERVVRKSGYEFRQSRSGYRVVVPLGGERRQKVYVMFAGHDDDGHDIISYVSLCAKADDQHAMALLRLNNKLNYGAFAVRTIEGTEYFVVTASQLADTADDREVAKQLFEVATRADAIEHRLNNGKDIF